MNKFITGKLLRKLLSTIVHLKRPILWLTEIAHAHFLLRRRTATTKRTNLARTTHIRLYHRAYLSLTHSRIQFVGVTLGQFLTCAFDECACCCVWSFILTIYRSWWWAGQQNIEEQNFQKEQEMNSVHLRVRVVVCVYMCFAKIYVPSRWFSYAHTFSLAGQAYNQSRGMMILVVCGISLKTVRWSETHVRTTGHTHPNIVFGNNRRI